MYYHYYDYLALQQMKNRQEGTWLKSAYDSKTKTGGKEGLHSHVTTKYNRI